MRAGKANISASGIEGGSSDVVVVLAVVVVFVSSEVVVSDGADKSAMLAVNTSA